MSAGLHLEKLYGEHVTLEQLFGNLEGISLFKAILNTYQEPHGERVQTPWFTETKEPAMVKHELNQRNYRVLTRKYIASLKKHGWMGSVRGTSSACGAPGASSPSD